MARVVMIIAALVLVALIGVLWWAWTPDLPRAELETRYQPAETIEVLGIHLRERDTGPRDSPAILMLHGFGSSLSTWDAWAADLERDHRVVRYDLPGFGLTGADPTGDYSEARGMAVLAGLLDRLGIARVALIGNSMGGKLAWEFAADHPDRITGLVLVSPDGFASKGFAYDEPAKVPFMLRLLPHAMPRMMLRMGLAPAYADPSKLSAETVTRYFEMMRAPGVRQAIIDRLGQTVLKNPVPLLAKIAAPTLLLWGDRDAMIPIANAADYQAALKSVELVTLPGIGHVPQEEAPTASLVPLRRFLARLPRG